MVAGRRSCAAKRGYCKNKRVRLSSTEPIFTRSYEGIYADAYDAGGAWPESIFKIAYPYRKERSECGTARKTRTAPRPTTHPVGRPTDARTGFRNARAKGKSIGRPPLTYLPLEARNAIANAYRQRKGSLRHLAAQYGTSVGTVKRCVEVFQRVSADPSLTA